MPAPAQILVLDANDAHRAQLDRLLANAGLPRACFALCDDAVSWLDSERPIVALIRLAQGDEQGPRLLRHLREASDLADTPVVALTTLGSDPDIGRIFASGADEYVHEPFRPAELIQRLKAQVRVRNLVERLKKQGRAQQTMIELTHSLAQSLDLRTILFGVVKRLAQDMDVDRCSVVLVGAGESTGYVIASSDNPGLRGLAIDLRRYPEIREVLGTGRPLVIHDTLHHPLLEVVRQNDVTLDFESIALVPILHDHEPMGVFFLRSRHAPTFAEEEIAIIDTLATATAIALRNARLLQALRDENKQSTVARAQAEERVELFQRYADFFESAADGMVVIDRRGTILFANPRAREITGFSETELMKLPLQDLFVSEERHAAERLLRGFSEGVYPRGIDLRVTNRSGAELILSLSFSSVLHEDNAVLFSFRDVTRERRLAIELKQTKDFLERVIDSSVDAIVSTDLKGMVLVFNRAAARIFRYHPSDVIAKMSAENLYPAGVAREVMRRIRSAAAHGGHLEHFRVDMMDAEGGLIPTILSAALVMNNGKPVGTVGIFTDIRERLEMEARLSHAQEELRTREKQALIAEIAGTTAHELNQPLTSVLGYAEWLKRKLASSAEYAHATDVIMKESERMAEIVRKLGKITKYETKSYVGSQQILDLDRAANLEPGSEENT